MKNKYLIWGVIVLVLIIIVAAAVLYNKEYPIEGGVVPFKIVDQEKSILLKIPLSEDSVQRLAQKMIYNSSYNVGRISKNESSGEWRIYLDCKEDPGYVCGGILIVNEKSREIYRQFLA